MGQASTAERRKRLLSEIGPQGVLVLAASRELVRNNDVPHPFRQDSDFYYLTEFDEPDAVLVLVGGQRPESVLFVLPRDPAREVWDGPRAGVEGAVAQAGVDRALPLDRLEAELPGLLLGKTDLHCRLDEQGLAPFVAKALASARRLGRRGAGYPVRLLDSDESLHAMRKIKSAAELEKMSKAAQISVDAHRQAMQFAKPGRFEYEVEAQLEAAFRSAGCQRAAYRSIVASGEMATTLHYVANNRKMDPGQLLLIDAGCEYEYYAADITRTFPISGQFSVAQREVYQVVLDAQYAALEQCVVGRTMQDIHRAAVTVISKGLVSLGVLSGSVAEVVERKLYEPYYMHKTGHYLGMDVHDVGHYYHQGLDVPLAEGTVLTVEPGLYFPPSAPEAAAQYRGIGIRIEDDVAIALAGPNNLTAGLPKEAAEVERLCSL